MRSSKSRSRSKSNRQRSLGNIVNRVFDSSGPEGKVRGTPQQIIEKYLTLARDAQVSGDRVAEQSFLQHAEHYTRMLGEAQREMAERQSQHQQNNPHHQQNRQGGDDDQGRESGRNDGQHQNGRDQGHRDHAPRDQAQRDQNPRDQAPRKDHAPRHEDVAAENPADAPAAGDAPAAEAPTPVADRATGAEALPDAVGSDEADTGGLVQTPEAEPAKPSRSRSSRSGTATRSTGARGTSTRSTTTRSRRKPADSGETKAPDGGDAPVPDGNGEAQG